MTPNELAYQQMMIDELLGAGGVDGHARLGGSQRGSRKRRTDPETDKLAAGIKPGPVPANDDEEDR